MCADDTNLFLSSINVDDLSSDMNCELNKISFRFKANKLSLNLTKTKYSLFHPASKKRFLREPLTFLKMDNIVIERENATKFLGVIIDENLSWKQHINGVTTKISKSIGILYNSRGIVKQPLLKQLHFHFIQYHLIYANIAWASTYKSKLEGIYRHQKHMARIINFKDRFTHAQPLLHNMKALNIFEIDLFHMIFFMFKCKKKIAPFIFHNLFTPIPENKYHIRSRGKLTTPFYRIKRTQLNIDYRGPHLRNELAHYNFRTLDSLPLFYKKIKEFISMFHDTEQYFYFF